MHFSGMTNTTDIARHVPSLQFDSGSGGGVNAFVSIRGVSQVDYSEHQEAPNAVYLDEVYVPTPSMVSFPVYDMARVEALRGPQGTLFGRNSTGGLLHFVTTDPSNSWEGFGDIQYSSYSTVRTEGAVGGPVAEGVTFRLAGFATVGDGFFKNNNPGEKDTFEQYSFGLRGKVKFDLGGDWSAKITGSYNKSPKHREGVYKAVPAYVDANGVSQFVPLNLDPYGTGAGNDMYGYRDPTTRGTEGSFNDFGRLSKEMYYTNLKIEGSVGDATLSAISNYTSSRLAYIEDPDGTPNDIYRFASTGKTRQFSQEVRLSGESGNLNWTVGAYFLDLRGSYSTEFAFFDNQPTPSTFDPINQYRQHTQSYAVFSQAEYLLADRLKVTVGGRYTHDQKTFVSRVIDPTQPGSPTIYDFSKATVGDLAEQSRGDWAGKAALSYEMGSGALLYASVSRGIRGGGFNATADGSLPYANVPFGSETVIAYEAGAKIRLLDNKVNVRSSAFYYDYSNYQAYNFNGFTSVVSNNDAYYYGGELELFTEPAPGLTISLGGSYLKTRVKDVITPAGRQDVEAVKAPKWTLNGIIAKIFNIGDYQLNLQYDFDYVSDSRANLVPSPITALPASWLQNARIGLGREAFGWEAFAFVKNLANVSRRSFAYDNTFTGVGISSYVPPRIIGVGFRKAFK